MLSDRELVWLECMKLAQKEINDLRKTYSEQRKPYEEILGIIADKFLDNLLSVFQPLTTNFGGLLRTP